MLSKLTKSAAFTDEVENRDIKVAEQTKVSKLCNVGTPLRLSESFFDDVLFNMVVGYTKLYGHRDKADTSFEMYN